jgi:hypothetical protein
MKTFTTISKYNKWLSFSKNTFTSGTIYWGPKHLKHWTYDHIFIHFLKIRIGIEYNHRYITEKEVQFNRQLGRQTCLVCGEVYKGKEVKKHIEQCTGGLEMLKEWQEKLNKAQG